MSDLTKKINVVGKLATLSKTVDFDNFYNISISIRNDQIALQGNLNTDIISGHHILINESALNQ